ncbi:MAG TPA: hypothetical protein VFR91_09145 [Dyella sp.]|nr:hypothetical protein [Dyella sp.]
MTALHDYERWLDKLDTRLYVRDGWLVSEFGATFSVPIAAVRSAEDLLRSGERFMASLASEQGLPLPYLAGRFHRLLDPGKRFGLAEGEFESRLQAGIGRTESPSGED